MFERFAEMVRSERNLPSVIRLQLIDGLFYPFASLISGALAGLWVSATVTFTEGDPFVLASAALVVVVAFARILAGMRYVSLNGTINASQMYRWEKIYGVGAGLFSFSLGLVTLLALVRVNHPPLHLMLTTTTAAYAASIAGRNAGRPQIALSQLYLAAVPMCIGLVLNGTPFYQTVGFALLIFMFGMTDITLSIRRTLVEALETRQRNAELAKSFERQATLFDDALNNMSHGLCMYNKSGELLVFNHKFVQLTGAKANDFHEGMPLEDMLARMQANYRQKSCASPLAEAIRNRVREGRAEQDFVRLGNGQQVISVSSQTMDNGDVVIVFEDVTEQSKAHERIQQLAWSDELTGLMNRASFRQVLTTALEHLEGDARLALHLIDLDLFKEVNDTLGHPIGDLLLKEVAKRLVAIAGRQCHVCRLGGDEFVVIEPLSGPDSDPESLANSLVEELGEPFEISGHRLNIGASIGIAHAPEHGLSVDHLLKRADMALYKAKALGRNTAVTFESHFDFQAQQRRQIELDLRAAITNGQFAIALQPIVGLESGHIESFETLIRWNHPERGFVSPVEFIPVAEETGLIVEIGRWVLERACHQAVRWKSPATVAVNFSAAQFLDKGFPDFLKATLLATGLEPGRLELEITETALLDENPDIHAMLTTFREMGVGVSLDDFGTGYSSLSQLRAFPFSKIKVDRSFVDDLGRDASAVAVASAVASIGRILGIAVVAEGVETEEQLSFLISAGCTHVQGYLFSKPIAPREVAAVLRRHNPDLVRKCRDAA